MLVNVETYEQGTGRLIERRVPADGEWIVYDGDGVEVRRDEFTAAEIEEHARHTPDPGGLLLAIFAAFGKNNARGLARAYPDFQSGLDRGNWAVARGAVDDALANDDINQTAFNTIQSLFTQYGIPEV